MGHSHSHDTDGLGDVPVSPLARTLLIAFLGAALVATVLGLFQLWPDQRPKADNPSNAFAAPGTTYPSATVQQVQPLCPRNGEGQSGNQAPTCGQVRVRLDSGAKQGESVLVPVSPQVTESGLRRGDTMELLQTPTKQGQPATFAFFGVDRDLPIALLAGIFVLVVAAVARLRGLLALVGLGFSGLVLVKFMLPALLDEKSGLGVAVVGSAAIMFVVLYLAHGLSVRTSAALAGTLLGVGVTAVIGLLTIDVTRLSGASDETASTLGAYVSDLDFQGLLTCAVIVAGLGVLNDVTITQASAVWELRGAAPSLSRSELFSRAMRIGRDHIASTIYTIVFAYSGAALSVLLLLVFYQRPILSLVSTEDISEEIVRTLASGIGLVLAVPITTAIAVLTVGGRSSRRPTRGGGPPRGPLVASRDLSRVCPSVWDTWPMRVSAKSDYALRALIEIAGHCDDRAVSAEELGKAQEIPHGFLQAILADLRRAGVVVSQRGQAGGWRMAREADQVSVADVIRAVDGPLVSVYGLRPEAVTYQGSAEVLQLVWIAARSSLRDVFEQVTIAALAARELPEGIERRTRDDDAWQPH